MSDGIKEKDIQFDGEPPLHFSGDTVLENKARPVKPLSRRDFLKVAGLGLAVASTVKLPDIVFALSEIPSRKIDDVEVYGLDVPIKTQGDIESFYRSINDKFCRENGADSTANKSEERKEVLNPKERYLEVVVRKSAYESFERKKNQTGATFEKWIKTSLLVANKSIEKALPRNDLRGILKRIIVVDDEAVKGFWDESAYREGKGVGLDMAWKQKFESSYPLDIDCSWAIADDFRDSPANPNFWKVSAEKDKLVVSNPRRAVYAGKTFIFPPANSEAEFAGTSTEIDMDTVHEWSHFLFSLPDEYTQDVHDYGRVGYSHYLFSTGSFALPYLSSYLSYLAERNISRKIRTLGTPEFRDIPKNTAIKIKSNSNDSIQDVEIRRIRMLDNSLYGRKEFPQTADRTANSDTITFDGSLMEGESNSWLISSKSKEKTRHLFFPAACLNICKLAGQDDSKLEISFESEDDPSRKTQEVIPIDLSEEAMVRERVAKNGWKVFASMRIPNTSTLFLWYLTNSLPPEKLVIGT